MLFSSNSKPLTLLNALINETFKRCESLRNDYDFSIAINHIDATENSVQLFETDRELDFIIDLAEFNKHTFCDLASKAHAKLIKLNALKSIENKRYCNYNKIETMIAQYNALLSDSDTNDQVALANIHLEYDCSLFYNFDNVLYEQIYDDDDDIDFKIAFNYESVSQFNQNDFVVDEIKDLFILSLATKIHCSSENYDKFRTVYYTQKLKQFLSL